MSDYHATLLAPDLHVSSILLPQYGIYLVINLTPFTQEHCVKHLLYGKHCDEVSISQCNLLWSHKQWSGRLSLHDFLELPTLWDISGDEIHTASQAHYVEYLLYVKHLHAG